jgi:hypothetical protein
VKPSGGSLPHNDASMSSINPPSGLPPSNLSVSAFRETAEQAPAVRVALEDGQFTVLGQGQMSGSSGSRSVAWVKGDVDTTSMFLNSLSRSFGAGLSAAIARELGLEPAPGKPLASRLIKEALDMAEAGQRAMTGVDFATFLDHSAVSNGPGFRAALGQAGLEPSAVTSAQRQSIDNAVRAHFEMAASDGKTPVDPKAAASWLAAEIARLTKASG